MASSRGFSDIVNSMIERLKVSQPNLDTKPGSVSRDLFIDLPADQIARFYSVLNIISQKQSLSLSAGQDLDLTASNFGLGRRTGSPSSGFVAICINNISADIPIPSGTVVTARNGLTFKTLGNYSLSVSDKSRLSANANRLRKSLNLAGISANYVLEIPAECTRVGVDGNISTLQIVSADLSLNGITATNFSSFTGGQNRESDDSFRSRIISVFSGANIGTSSGYRSAALSVSGVQDAIVVEPGSTLMLRDGTEIISTIGGENRILNSGTGGKVDIYILGNRTSENIESYIYNDRSGLGDATRPENDYILGQQNQDLSRTIEERRYLSLKNDNLPIQPVSNLISVIGSRSGEFVQRFTNQFGEISGNFELIKDYSSTIGGSPFGYDKIHFISNQKEINAESVQKTGLNSLDSLSYSDISNIKNIYIDISENNDIGIISKTSRSTIILNHKPVIRVNRVQNITTGEVYSVVNQNINENTGTNLLGEIVISGKQLPSPSDSISISYIWRKYFTPDIDFPVSNNETVYRISSSNDVVDWTTSNGIKREISVLTLSDDLTEYQIETSNPITNIKSVWIEESENALVKQLFIDGKNVLGIEILETEILNVISIKRNYDNMEVFNTTSYNGKIISNKIILPSDSQVSIGDSVKVFFNKVELYNYDGNDGSFSQNIIKLPSQQNLEANNLLDIVNDSFSVERPIYINYVASINNILLQNDISNLPAQSVTLSNSIIGLGGSLGVTKQPIELLFESSIPTDVIRYSPCQLNLIFSSILSPGKIRISGESFNTYIFDIPGNLFSGRRSSISRALSNEIGSLLLESYGIARILNIKHISAGNINDLDIHGYSLLNNLYDKNRCSIDQNLNALEFVIPNINNNPTIYQSGDIVRITCQVYNTSEQEDIIVRSSSQKITKNTFGRINSISVVSGFRNSANLLRGSMSIEFFNQPASFSPYNCDYSFIAPKNGERIQISYNYNRLILDVTNAIELSRPITADVLVKEAFSLPVDIFGTILINDNFLLESENIKQNAITALTSALNTNSLGSKIDYSDIISVVAGIRGVDSVNISIFNKSGLSGRKAFIQSLENQTIIPGTISLEVVSKDKFKIN